MKNYKILFKEKNLAYRVKGTGTPIFFLHGFCEDSTIWDEFITELPHFKIILPDFSGFGKSERIENFTIETLAESVKAIADAQKIEKCIFVGHSMGGYVALALAEMYPNLVAGLCLFHSHCFADTDTKKLEREKSIDFIKKSGHIMYVKQFVPNLFAEMFSSSNAFLMNSLIYKASAYQSESIIAALEAMKQRPDRSHVLAQLKSPVSLIIGKLDRAIPVDISFKMLTLNPFTDLLILPQVAHMGMFTAKAQTARAILEFKEICYS